MREKQRQSWGGWGLIVFFPSLYSLFSRLFLVLFLFLFFCFFPPTEQQNNKQTSKKARHTTTFPFWNWDCFVCHVSCQPLGWLGDSHARQGRKEKRKIHELLASVLAWPSCFKTRNKQVTAKTGCCSHCLFLCVDMCGTFTCTKCGPRCMQKPCH